MLHLIKRSMVIGLALVAMVLNSWLSANGQTISDSPLRTPTSSATVTAASSSDVVRFRAPGNNTRIRLEVFAPTGEKVFDSGNREGNMLDWRWQDDKAQVLGEGIYLCVVTVESLSGKTSRKLTNVSFANQQATLQPVEATQLSPAQARVVGATETDTPLTIINPEQPMAATVIAHDGADGMIVRGRGALSFRIGDFFSGKDEEQMRLTEAGDLGIGTSEPKTKLDVAGTVRAQRFLVVKPDKLSSRAASDSAPATDAANSVQPLISGVGTTGQLPKWTDGANGALGDSVITETAGGNIGIGTTSPTDKLEVKDGFISTYHSNASFGAGYLLNTYTNTTGSTKNTIGQIGVLQSANNVRSGDFVVNLSNAGAPAEKFRINHLGNVGIGTMIPGRVLDVVSEVQVSGRQDPGYFWKSDSGTAGARNWGSFINYNTFGDFVIRQSNALAGDPYSAGITRLQISPSGNIGIGTIIPVSKLDVAGDINTSTQYNIAGIRVLDIKANNTFAGVGAGLANAGDNNTFVGNMAGSSKNSGDGNAFFGSFAGNSNASGNGNAFFGFEAGKGNINGGTNSFFGFQAGRQNTNATGNSFFGALSGAVNTTGQFNSFVGYQAGNANAKGDGNSFFGNAAGSDNTTGSFNVSIGYAAGNGPGVGNQNGSNNVSIGYASGQIVGNNQSGASNNTFIGAAARGQNNDTATQSYATAIGAGAVAGGNNGVWLGRKGLDDVTVGRLLTIGLFDHVGAGEELCRSIPESYGPSDLVSICSSSLRYKTEVKTYLGGLDIVRRLRPITFNWRKTGHQDLGFGAEEVEQVEPLLVFYNEKGETDGVKYRQITAVLVNAVNEQQTQITAQQRTIEQQKLQLEQKDSQIESLKAGLARQETRLAAVESRVKSLAETKVAGESRAAARPNQ